MDCMDNENPLDQAYPGLPAAATVEASILLAQRLIAANAGAKASPGRHAAGRGRSGQVGGLSGSHWGKRIRSTGRPPTFSRGRYTRWVAGSTDTECAAGARYSPSGCRAGPRC